MRSSRPSHDHNGLSTLVLSLDIAATGVLPMVRVFPGRDDMDMCSNSQQIDTTKGMKQGGLILHYCRRFANA
ncbi:hypothetical protein SOVF_187110 [Spinacia oleracea]|nr:hypothetical protein SOVF_187110 [Spinacia oleracea]